MDDRSSLLAYRWHRTGSRLRAALRREGGTLWAGLRDPLLLVLLLLTLLLVSASFQAQRALAIAVGQQPPDLVYLDGVYEVETSAGRPFRWTRAEAGLHIPGLGQAPYRLDLTMAAPRFSPGPEPHLRVRAGGQTLLDAPVGPAVQVYTLLVPPEVLRGGDLELLLQSDAFTPTRFLCSIGPDWGRELDRGELSAGLRDQLQQNGIGLTPQAVVKVKQAGNNWTIVDGAARYFVRSEDQTLNVYAIADPRQLGVVLQRVEVRPAGGLVRPAPGVLLGSALAVLLVVLLARRLGWARWAALGAGAAAALALAAALAWARPLLTPGLPNVPLALVCAWAAVVLFQGPVRRLWARSGAAVGPRAERLLWTVVAFFFVVRLAGILHPAMETFDLCFHLNRMQEVMRGKLLLTIISREWGSQETLYLPSVYLLVAPFWALLRGQLVPFKIAELLLDTSAALLTAYLARRLLGRGAAAPLAALCYLTMRQSYIIFSWGIVSNMLGQWLLLAVLALLVSPAGRLERPRAWWGAAGLLFLAVLAHPGTVQLTGLLLTGLLLAVLLAPPAHWPRRAARRWLLAGAAAVALGLVLYYSYFVPTMWKSLQQMGQSAAPPCDLPDHGGIQVCGPVVNPGLGLYAVEVFGPAAAVVAGAREIAAEARAYYFTLPLLLAALALPGLLWERRGLALRLLGMAWWLALAYALVGLATNLYVRYMYFLLPFVALGLAWWGERLRRRGWAGRALVLSAALLLILAGLAFWVQQVLYYAAGCRW